MRVYILLLIPIAKKDPVCQQQVRSPTPREERKSGAKRSDRGLQRLRRRERERLRRRRRRAETNISKAGPRIRAEHAAAAAFALRKAVKVQPRRGGWQTPSSRLTPPRCGVGSSSEDSSSRLSVGRPRGRMRRSWSAMF